MKLRNHSALACMAAFALIDYGNIPMVGKAFAQSTSPIALQAPPSASNPSVKPLFCAYGGSGYTGHGEDTRFAVAVIEITSPMKVSNVELSDFELSDISGQWTKGKRIVEAEEFVKTRGATERDSAYYLNSGGIPWNGSLPVGTIRLRVRVALTQSPTLPVLFRLKVGPTVVEGNVAMRWGSA